MLDDFGLSADGGGVVDLYTWLDQQDLNGEVHVSVVGEGGVEPLPGVLPLGRRPSDEVSLAPFAPEAVAAREAEVAGVLAPPAVAPAASAAPKAVAAVVPARKGGRVDKGTRKEQVARAYKKYRAKKKAQQQQLEDNVGSLTERVAQLEAQLRDKQATIEMLQLQQARARDALQAQHAAAAAEHAAVRPVPRSNSGAGAATSSGGSISGEDADAAGDRSSTLHCEYMMEVSRMQAELQQCLVNLRTTCAKSEAAMKCGTVSYTLMHLPPECEVNLRLLTQVERCLNALSSWSRAAPEAAHVRELNRACLAAEMGRTGVWAGDQGIVLIRQMMLSSRQVASILALREELSVSLGVIFRERAELNARLVDALQAQPGGSASASSGGSGASLGSSGSIGEHVPMTTVEAARTSLLLDKVKASLRDEINERTRFSMRLLRECLSPSQSAVALIYAFPEVIDLLEFANMLSALKSAMPADDSALNVILASETASGEECRFAECHDEVKRWRALILTAGDNPGAHAAPAEGFRERIKICAETGAVHVRDGREAMGVQ